MRHTQTTLNLIDKVTEWFELNWDLNKETPHDIYFSTKQLLKEYKELIERGEDE